ncbi:HIT family protein [Brevibacillus centrosporus]|uniref:HIT family protein n=1 Tax=Brevibacillus centrosporus TaxID=54910 RepID=UPI003B02BCF8
MILPKKHFTDLVDLDIGTATEIMKASQKITTALKKVIPVEGVSVCEDGGIFKGGVQHKRMNEKAIDCGGTQQ